MPSLDFAHAWPWLQWVIAVAAVVAFIGGAIRIIPGAWRAVSRFVTTINSLADLPEFIKRTDESTGKLERQILNNHPEDSNMREEITEAKDAALRAVELAEGLHGRVDVLEQSNARQEVSIGEVQAKLIRDHQRLGVLEHTLPQEAVQALVEQARDESDG